MKIVKGVLVYTLIIIGILLVLGMLIFGAMFLFPNLKVFGWSVLNKNNEVNAAIVAVTTTKNSEYNLIIDSNVYNVEIEVRNDGSDSVSVVKTDKMLGLYNPAKCTKAVSGDKSSIWDLKVIQSDKTITIESSDIFGAFSASGSVIKIFIPDNNCKYNITANTTSGNVTLKGIDAAHTLTVKSLNVTTTTGDLTASNLTKTDSVLSLDSLNLKTDSGEFVLGNETTDETIKVTNSNVNLTANRGSFKFANLEVSKELIINGKDILLSANEIKTGTNFNFNAPNGYFKINKLVATTSTIATKTINVDIKSVAGTLSITTTYGNITLGTIANKTSLSSVHGDITITEAQDSISAITEYGDINAIYNEKAYFKNNHGLTNVTFVGNGIGDEYYNYTCNIQTGDGTINANNLMAETKISSTNGGTINATFTEMYKANEEKFAVMHEINLSTGKANIKVDRTKSFMFKGTGNISGSVGSAVMAATEGDAFVQKLSDSVTPNNLAHLKVNAGNGKVSFSTI